MKLLVIEDDRLDFELAARLLRRASDTAAHRPEFSVDWAPDLRTGLTLLEKDRYDAALLDLSLPDADGIGTLHIIVAAAPSLPIVLLTARDDLDLAVQAVKDGAQDYLIKGRIDSEILVRTLLYACERKRHLEETRLLEQELRRSDKLKSLGIFAGGVAHDFNNLLMGVQGNLELARREIPNGSGASQALERAESALSRAAKLTSQILTYTGVRALKLEPLCLNAIVSEMSELLRTIVAKNSTLEMKLSDDLPPILGDTDQIGQVVMNFVTNASEALGGKAGTVTVATRASDDREQVMLEVSDTGTGMDAETKSRIFDPFFSTKFTGRGLGLATVFGIVRAHNANLEVESQPYAGSTFRVVFTAEGKDTPVEHGEEGKNVDFEPGSGTVLVVDDESFIRDVLEAILLDAGYKVATAERGHEALALLKTLPGVSYVLLDVTMPDLPGEEVLAEIRRTHPSLPVIMMSGYAANQLKLQLDDAQPVRMLRKPFKREELLETLQNLAG